METQTSSGSSDDEQTNGTSSGNATDNTISKQIPLTLTMIIII